MSGWALVCIDPNTTFDVLKPIQMHKAKMFHKLVVNIELGIKSISSPHLHVQMHLISLWLNQMHVSAFNWIAFVSHRPIWTLYSSVTSVTSVFFSCIRMWRRIKESKMTCSTHMHVCCVSTQPHMALIHTKYVMRCDVMCLHGVCVCSKNDDAICCCNDVSRCVHLALSHTILAYVWKFLISLGAIARGFRVECTCICPSHILCCVVHIFTLCEMYGRLTVLTLAYVCVCVYERRCCCVLSK